MNRTMLIATHDLEAASEIVDWAIVLNVEPVMKGTMHDLVRTSDVLEKTGLEMPPLPRIFRALEKRGYAVEALPLTMDQASAELTRLIDREATHGRRRMNDSH
jgi:energy-coupling factor transporter ATP-binding protein EcfA2